MVFGLSRSEIIKGRKITAFLLKMEAISIKLTFGRNMVKKHGQRMEK